MAQAPHFRTHWVQKHALECNRLKPDALARGRKSLENRSFWPMAAMQAIARGFNG
jgi:hypothetical protein